jgi:hypothetical protein
MRIEPDVIRSESELESMREHDDLLRSDLLRGESYDTGLSKTEERHALVFAILSNLN